MPDDKNKYPGNSHVSKSEKATEKKVERVTSGEVIQRKQSLGKRIAEAFAGDDMHSVGSYLLFEVALPALKTTISDMVSQGIERMLFGGGPARSTSTRQGATYTSYNRMYTGGSIVRREEPRTLSRQARANHDFREIILMSRGEAEQVIDQLQALIDQYDVATVSDLYQLVGISGTFAEEKWGWTDLRQAHVRRIREGYLLDLPRPVPLD